MSVGISMFKDAKLGELVKCLLKAPQDERDRVYEIALQSLSYRGKRLDQIKRGKTNKARHGG